MITYKRSSDTTFNYVTHGIFSQGFSNLLSIFSNIITTNSFIPSTPYPSNIEVLPIQGLLI